MDIFDCIVPHVPQNFLHILISQVLFSSTTPLIHEISYILAFTALILKYHAHAIPPISNKYRCQKLFHFSDIEPRVPPLPSGLSLPPWVDGQLEESSTYPRAPHASSCAASYTSPVTSTLFLLLIPWRNIVWQKAPIYCGISNVIFI